MDSRKETETDAGVQEEGHPSALQLVRYQGFWFASALIDKIKEAQEKFVAREGDILLCSYPKTGTTWLKALTFAIATRSEYNIDQSPLLTNFPHHCIPYIEDPLGNHTFKECHEGQRRLLATHLPYTSLPSNVVDMLHTGSSKMVYICRDPKDTLVSTWHFRKIFPSFDDMFEKFCQGKQLAGPYWDHLLGYWKACKEHPQTTLFLRYEDLKMNTEENVKNLAEFLGFPFSPREEEAGEVKKIIDLCSIENLKNLEVNKTGTFEDVLPGVKNNNKILFRKGEIGDWKTMLTPEMKKKLDLIFQEKLNGEGIFWA